MTIRAALIEPLGDEAYLARFRTASEAACWAEAVRRAGWKGVLDVVAAYDTAAVYLDADLVDFSSIEMRLRLLDALTYVGPAAREPRLIELPVHYDGPDLEIAARRLGLDSDEVVAQHSATPFEVFAIGFLPGFPYAGYLPKGLAGLPRRASPRARVEAGSVAIAGRQTGVYPCASPGGWHVIGHTPLTIVDVEAGFFPIRAGDRLQFRVIDAYAFEACLGGRL